MDRHRQSSLALAFLLLTAGCTGAFGSFGGSSAGGDGEFHAVAVSEAPPNATVVPYDDDRVAENEYLQRAVRQAANRSEAVVTVPEADVERTKAGVNELPLYTLNQSSSTEYEWGYYVRYERTVVRVEFAVLD